MDVIESIATRRDPWSGTEDASEVVTVEEGNQAVEEGNQAGLPPPRSPSTNDLEGSQVFVIHTTGRDELWAVILPFLQLDYAVSPAGTVTWEVTILFLMVIT